MQSGKSFCVKLNCFALHRFYVENITQLKDIITVELFFLNAKSAVFNVSVCLLVFFSSVTERLSDDSLSLDPFGTTTQQTVPAGLNFPTLPL